MIELVSNPALDGQKRAVFIGGKLSVSPAMYHLIKHAENPRELETVLRSIKVIKLDSSANAAHDMKWWLDTMQIELAKSGLSLAGATL